MNDPLDRSTSKLGLHSGNTAGRWGAYRPWADHTNAVQLATCLARDTDLLATENEALRLLGGPVLPLSHVRTHLGYDWTGNAYRYTWDGDGLDVYLKTTLPGPLFIPHGTTFHFRWAIDDGVPEAQSLPDGKPFRCAWTNDAPGQVVLLRNWTVPTLLVTSEPIVRMCWVSHEHMDLDFAGDRVRVLLVPLRHGAEAALTAEDCALWRHVVEAPPVACEETYEVTDSPPSVRLRQEFTSVGGGPSTVAPLPALWTFCADHNNLIDLPAGRQLIRGHLGPYRVLPGSCWEATIRMDWAQAPLQATRPVSPTGLAGVPADLAFGGDDTWEPGTPMDQLLALRVWAPLADICPPERWAQLAPRLQVPQPEAFRNSLRILAEPHKQMQWAKEARLFFAAGDVAYDSEWYNGLELSGLWRATQCADRRIAEAALRLARECQPERRLLLNYFVVSQDWELGSYCTDARGVLWNLDGIHNGLEGLLAEAALAGAEQDSQTRELCLYLAARTAVSLMAAEWYADYAREIHFFRPHRPENQFSADPATPTFGTRTIFLNLGACVESPRTADPYILAGQFPEFCRLQRGYGRVDRYREMAARWAAEHPERYRHWNTWCRPPSANAPGQEAAPVSQAAVFFVLAPEVCWRLWTLGESPDAIEARYSMMHLAEQLLCRAAVQIPA